MANSVPGKEKAILVINGSDYILAVCRQALLRIERAFLLYVVKAARRGLRELEDTNNFLLPGFEPESFVWLEPIKKEQAVWILASLRELLEET